MIDVSNYLNIDYRKPLEPGPGMHCWELSYKILTEVFAICCTDFDECPEHEAMDKFIADVDSWWPVAEPIPGLLVIFKIGSYYHCGVMISNRQFIHVLQGRRSVIEDVENRIWKKRIEGFYRWAH
ncbi:NlpC/P60 family protein [Vibrio breoganii]|uniref:NlpC/P60 family protein n=1 Tax=Vibrio breoganii TaxID=553239 RepID=UPI000C832CEC|nr:NlpC/P60 family protein [Vibrio breoganii]PMK30670.1 hypothetical protein BCU03_09650 [Vibrio breoganii]